MPTTLYDDDVLYTPHGRSDPFPPGTLADTDQFELPRDPDPQGAPERILAEQKNDLAMLRLFFRHMSIEGEEERKKQFPEYPYKNLTHAEYNQITTAVIRIHDDEREVYGFGKTLEPHSNPEQEEYEKLTQLSKRELIQLCSDNGIIPPDTCETETQT
jgi:hypothetical protein